MAPTLFTSEVRYRVEFKSFAKLDTGELNEDQTASVIVGNGYTTVGDIPRIIGTARGIDPADILITSMTLTKMEVR